jgi:IS605 OrfB family transposase
VAAIIRLATASGCRSIVIEDLDFTDVRQVGRETLGRGRRGKSFRRVIAGIPTRRFRTMLVGMAANQGLSLIAVDPAWTSKWGKWYWLTPLAKSTKSPAAVTVHHAAAVVIARRGLGLRARRRQGVPGYDQRIVVGKLPARPDRQSLGRQGPGPPEGQRAATAARKTRSAKRTRLGNQVIQDRLGSPEQDGLLLARQKR